MLVFEAKNCTECHACRLRCSFARETEYNPDKARLNIVGKWPELPELRVCRQCSNPPCIEACPVSALSQGSDKIIIIDYGLCTECGLCVSACPFGAVQTFEGKINICDTCAGEYPCIRVCSTGAISPKGRD